MEESLNKLIISCRKNDKCAQEKIYAKYAKRLANVVYRYTSTPHAIPDVLQNSFLKVFLSIKNFTGDQQNFYSWILRITINEALLWNRKNKSYHEKKLKEVSTRINGESIVLGNLGALEIFQVISTLNFDDRVIIQLAIVDDLDHQSISEILDISPSHSRTRLTRARKKLQNLIQAKLNIEV